MSGTGEPRYGWVPGKDGYRKFRILFDLALYKYNLRLTCRSCQHSRVLDGPGLWWKFETKHWPEELHAIGARFYCSKCLTEHRRRIYGPDMEVVGDKAEIIYKEGPDDYEWKRIVNRQRT